VKNLLQLIHCTIFLVLIFSTICIAQQIPDGPYFGQEAPGLVPEIFAPGIISLENRYEFSIAFSPDGKELYFSVTTRSWSTSTIMVTKEENGHWITPVTAPFSGYYDMVPAVSSDGQKIYFSSKRNNSSANIWTTEYTGDSWTAPQKLASPVSSTADEWTVSVAENETLYFSSFRTGGEDIYRTNLMNGKYTTVENLGDSINTAYSEDAPCLAPDGSYLIFTRRPGTYGERDLYISFQKEDGSWTKAENLGVNINSEVFEGTPTISPDGKYLFFHRRNGWISADIYWVSVKAFLPDPNGPVFNMMTDQRFSSIQTAIIAAQSGQTILLSPGEYKENIILPPKELTIRSANAQDSAIVSLTTISGDGQSPVVSLLPGGTIKLQGLTICDGAIGISCSGAQLQMNHCVVAGNQGCGVEVSNESHIEMSHCIVAGNTETGLQSLGKTVGRGEPVYSHVDITNCTIVQNQQYAIDGNQIAIKNSILYFNGQSAAGVQINGTDVNVMFSDVQGGYQGDGNIDANPEFVQLGTWADPDVYLLGDYHLKSTAGHWDPVTSAWLLNETSSPCIDTGDPIAPIGSEPSGNGGIINMGAYGGTPEASRTTIDE